MNFFKNKNFSVLNPERGVSLIITFFIMIVILTIVSSLSIILYSEVKVMRNMGNSVVSFYAAESGIEKVLYYDRQVLPVITITGVECSPENSCPTGQSCDAGFCAIHALRGLCSIFDSAHNGSSYCKEQASVGYDSSVYCNSANPDVANSPDTCTPSNCTNCTITFTTNLDNNRSYNTTAKVKASGDFEVSSGGIFGDTQRKINILISGDLVQSPTSYSPPPSFDSLPPPPAPCAILDGFISDSYGPTINSAETVLDGNGKMTISADVPGDIDYVEANIYTSIDGNCVKVTDSINLESKGSGPYSKPWTAGTVGTTYYILIDARNNSLEHTYLRLNPVVLE